jgi:hypothetical protein
MAHKGGTNFFVLGACFLMVRVFPPKGGEAMTIYAALDLALQFGIFFGLLCLILVVINYTKK